MYVCIYLWCKDLHDAYPSVDAGISNWFQPLGRHDADNERGAPGLDEVDVLRAREVSRLCGRHRRSLVRRHHVVMTHGGRALDPASELVERPQTTGSLSPHSPTFLHTHTHTRTHTVRTHVRTLEVGGGAGQSSDAVSTRVCVCACVCVCVCVCRFWGGCCVRSTNILKRFVKISGCDFCVCCAVGVRACNVTADGSEANSRRQSR